MQVADKNRRETLYHRIEQELRTRIREGKWKPGERFLSQREICEEYSVSAITANRVLQNIAASGLIERFPGQGNFLKDVSQGEKMATANKDGAVALIAPVRRKSAENSLFFKNFYSSIVQSVVNQAYSTGRHLRMAYLPEDKEWGTMTSPSEWVGEEVCGFIFFGVSGHCHQAQSVAGRFHGPAIFVDSYVEGFPSVVSNSAGAVAEVCQRLHALGHRKIGYLGNYLYGSNLTNETERLTLLETLAPHWKLQLDDRVLRKVNEETIDSVEVVREWAKKDRATAVICSTAGQFNMLRERLPDVFPSGRAKDRLSGVAIDAWQPEDSTHLPRVHGMLPASEEMGRTAFEWLMELVDGVPKKYADCGRITVPMKWYEGGTLFPA